MADLIAKFSLNKRQEIKAKFDATNRPTISAVFKITKTVSVHNELSGREEDDCHPIKAITGLQNALDGKQDVIEDLETIRSGAAKGETALQPSALNNTTLTGNTTAEALKIDGYNALTTNSTLDGGKISEGSVNKNALATGIQTSLDKADSAVQTIETGTANGTISVDGTDVEVKGLDSAAFTPASDYATAAQGDKADTAVQTITTGSSNGSINVDGTDIDVKGLGTAAYTNASDYATAEQGAKADTAIQSVSQGSANGTISVDGTDVAVKGLGTAAYENTSAFDASGAASTAETNSKNYADSLAINYATAAQGAKADTAVQPATLNNYVTTDTEQTISAAKTFTKAVHFTGTGDTNALFLTENTRIDVEGTTKTILGMANGQFYINHNTYDLQLRGRQTRPKYNNSTLALTSDIPTTYIHEQGVASAVWTVQHDLNKYPSVTVVDSSENVIIADVEYVDTNTVQITMNGASKGRAYLN